MTKPFVPTDVPGPVPDDGRCERCGAELTEDWGVSWPYCPVCDWCPDCGYTHEPHPDARV